MDYKARFYSPSLKRFIQPDSIIPGAGNSQSWNRYSYVLNRPITFNDPTGHSGDDNSPCGVLGDQCGTGGDSPVEFPSYPGDGNDNDPGQGGGGSGNPNDELKSEGKVENCVPYPGQWICDLDALNYEPEYCPTGTTLVNCWKQDLPLYMGEEPMNIDPAEWDALLLAIRNQIHGMDRWQLIAAAMFYDTPFYDNSVYGLGKLPGIGCIDQQCYDRSELNYIAEGELWAAAGFSIETTMTIVQIWKLSPIMHLPTVASGGTLIMTNIGYYDYKSHYPNESP